MEKQYQNVLEKQKSYHKAIPISIRFWLLTSKGFTFSTLIQNITINNVWFSRKYAIIQNKFVDYSETFCHVELEIISFEK